MNKIFCLILIFTGSLKNLSAQSLVNENMESWIDNSAFIDPEGWITLNDLSPEYGIPFTVLKTTDASEGQYAAMMQTYTFLDGNNNADTLPAIMVYGTDINAGIHYAWPKRLKAISFTYKYIPNGKDTGVMYLSVGYRNPVTKQTVNQGGTYFVFSDKVDKYTRVRLPLYYNSNHRCDTFVFAFINSLEKRNGNRCKPGTKLFIDDLDTEWEDFPAVAVSDDPDPVIKVYPNPVRDRFFLTGIVPANSRLQILNIQGVKVFDGACDPDGTDISYFQPGIYHILVARDGGLTSRVTILKK